MIIFRAILESSQYVFPSSKASIIIKDLSVKAADLLPHGT